ncbi:hypothetical protein K933_15505 [Candidatus Halobonum tyrrellensis G22]|uniref:Uncharacterized protein n=1 Tax=Candidatus Halobonum tyrrellensis G22 TaxID=1324957 RepID=V4HAR0_9EURY|nr:hypothetical protein K933_15505 [Candidatus Halobonum tyrrellensis G22]
MAFGVPLVFCLAVLSSSNLGYLVVVLAGGLAAYLYTRRTGRETLAAGLAGSGLLLVALFLLHLYWVGARGSTESLAGAAARLWGWPSAGAVLLALGYWVSGADRSAE